MKLRTSLLGPLAALALFASSPCAQDSVSAARALLQRGDLPGAEAMFERLVEADATDASAWFHLGYARHAQGKLEEALAAHERAAGFPEVATLAAYNAACAHALLGHADEAFGWLGRALDAGYSNRAQLEADADLASLRDDPRWAALLPGPAEGDGAFVEDVRVLHELHGENAGDQFGWVTRRVGDLDGDGLEDLAVTAPSWPGNGSWRGRVYVYSARTGRPLRIWQGRAGERFGNSVSAAGDLDGDGVGDVLVGAPGSAANPGRAYAFSGADGRELLALTANAPGDEFGLKLCELPDLDGDGVNELAVGAPKTAGGRVHVFSGKGGRQLWVLEGERPGDRLGSALDATLDADAPLLAVGEMGWNGTGRVRVFRARAERGELAFVIEPSAAGANLGQYFVTAVGDVDGDGVGDVFASDWNDGGAGKASGRVYVHSGATGERLLELAGEHAGEAFGTSASDAGDVDGDGRADLVVGAWQNAEGAPSGGKCRVHSGATGELLETFTGQVTNDTLGFDATGLGDVDGDGAPDLVLSSAWSEVRGPKTGRVFVVAGRAYER